jgi:hypothetical protein
VSHQNHRSGGKYCGSHTTIIGAASFLTDIAVRQSEVSKITLGFIKAGLPPAHGQRRVKFTADQGSLLLSVRDNVSHQEIRVYSTDVSKTRLSLARSARNAGIHIAFQEEVVSK